MLCLSHAIIPYMLHFDLVSILFGTFLGECFVHCTTLASWTHYIGGLALTCPTSYMGLLQCIYVLTFTKLHVYLYAYSTYITYSLCEIFKEFFKMTRITQALIWEVEVNGALAARMVKEKGTIRENIQRLISEELSLNPVPCCITTICLTVDIIHGINRLVGNCNLHWHDSIMWEERFSDVVLVVCSVD